MDRIIKRVIKVGNVFIGGQNPVSVQSMTTTNTADVIRTIEQIKTLEKSGCELIRVAVPNIDSAISIKEIKSKISIPIIADIHFDHKLAIQSLTNGADCVRINPGNIGNVQKIKEIITAANEYEAAIRIGVNSGSIENKLIDKYGGPTVDAMVESLISHVKIIEDLGFINMKLSIKASSVVTTINAYRKVSQITDYPLHVGVTEAGTKWKGTIRSAIGIGTLLAEGIGDTIRVSLTDDPVEEVKAAIEILKSLGHRNEGINIISCPTCGRCQVNLIDIAKKVEEKLESIDKNIKVAVMGCGVNGPGEAKEADIGIAGGIDEVLLFKKGNIIGKIPQEKAIEVLVDEIKKL